MFISETILDCTYKTFTIAFRPLCTLVGNNFIYIPVAKVIIMSYSQIRDLSFSLIVIDSILELDHRDHA